MHLADSFIQSDSHCIQMLSMGIEPMTLALWAPMHVIGMH